MRLEMGGIDHQRIGRAALIGQLKQHPCEDTLLAPALPTAVKGSLIAALSSVGRCCPSRVMVLSEVALSAS